MSLTRQLEIAKSKCMTNDFPSHCAHVNMISTYLYEQNVKHQLVFMESDVTNIAGFGLCFKQPKDLTKQ